MDFKKFKELVANAQSHGEIDDLCFSWLDSMASDFGENGEIAKEVLGIAKKLTSNY
jgi:hypothetical protein